MSQSFLLLLAACQGLAPVGPLPDGLDSEQSTETGTETGDTAETSDTSVDNTAPAANAGPDQTVELGSIVSLDGSGSSDADGDTLTLEWTLLNTPADSNAELLNPEQADPEFYADEPGIYTIELEVDDGEMSDVDEVEIHAEADNGAPTANAGPNQSVSVGALVQLNGSASTDPEDDELNFDWEIASKPAGSTASLDNPASPLPRFTADRSGTYTVSLVVDDGTHTSTVDSVQITAEAGDDSDCLSCSAEAQRQFRDRWTAGDAASGPALLLLPLLAAAWNRRRKR